MSSDSLDPEAAQELQAATERLVDQVSALSSALTAIGALQEAQGKLESKVKAVEEDVAENAVPRHEFTNATATIASNVRQQTQKRLRVLAISLSILALIGSGVSGYISYRVGQDQRVALCNQRNAEAKDNAVKTKAYFAPYIKQEQTNPKADPVFVKLLVAITQTPPQHIKCN